MRVTSAPIARKNDNNRKIGIIAVAASALVFILLGVFLFGGRGYKSTVKKYVNARYGADAKAFLKLMPKKIIDETMMNAEYDPDDSEHRKIFIEDLDK